MKAVFQSLDGLEKTMDISDRDVPMEIIFPISPEPARFDQMLSATSMQERGVRRYRFSGMGAIMCQCCGNEKGQAAFYREEP